MPIARNTWQPSFPFQAGLGSVSPHLIGINAMHLRGTSVRIYRSDGGGSLLKRQSWIGAGGRVGWCRLFASGRALE